MVSVDNWNRGYWICGYWGTPVHMSIDAKLCNSDVGTALKYSSLINIIIKGKKKTWAISSRLFLPQCWLKTAKLIGWIKPPSASNLYHQASEWQICSMAYLRKVSLFLVHGDIWGGYNSNHNVCHLFTLIRQLELKRLFLDTNQARKASILWVFFKTHKCSSDNLLMIWHCTFAGL